MAGKWSVSKGPNETQNPVMVTWAAIIYGSCTRAPVALVQGVPPGLVSGWGLIIVLTFDVYGLELEPSSNEVVEPMGLKILAFESGYRV